MNLIPRNFFLEDIFDEILPNRELSGLKCDIYEKENQYFIEMDTHGFDKNDVKLEFDKGELSIQVSSSEEKNDEGKTYIRKERHSKEYKRSFYVGEVNPEEITAQFDRGVLKISIPKEIKAEKTKRVIDIK